MTLTWADQESLQLVWAIKRDLREIRQLLERVEYLHRRQLLLGARLRQLLKREQEQGEER